MSQSYTKRLEYINVTHNAEVMRSSIKYVSKLTSLIESEPGRLLCTRYSSLFSDYRQIGEDQYALGYSIPEVRQSFILAAEAYLKVLEVRGTEEAFPVYEFVYDPSYPTESPESFVEFKEIDRGNDYSLGNSWDSYLAACLAFAVNRDTLARQIAGLIWDPPEASYVRAGSFCTPNGQRLAYAFRELIKGSLESSEAELKKVQVQKKEAMLFYQKKMIRALGNGDPKLFLEGLSLLMESHRKKARRTKDSKDYVCVSGLGLCRLALQQGLCKLEELPQDNVHLPLELLSTASG